MLGGYEVVRRLSEGASAEVFLARPDRADERVIVELIRPELFRETDLVTRFLDEARARKALSHPNVARRVVEGTAHDGRPFLVSEALGESLADWLRTRGPLDLETLIKLAIPLCDAVAYLHARGMVHGNIKPGAVHLGTEGVPHRPKLVDYGLALFRPGRTLPRPPGRILVEPEYMAPERIRGQRGTAAADIYALGVLMYEALTGAPPFTGDSPMIIKHRQISELPEPLPSHCARIAPIIERCLAKDPEARFATAGALREALAAELEGTLPLSAPVLPDPAALPDKGDVMGRYALVEPIGEGAMGRVFLARHTRLGRLVALKLLKPEHAENRDQVERFVREARAVNRIRNEHIVEIFDLVDEPVGQGRRVYCVMELLRGKTLGELLQVGPLPLQRSLKILHQVATALDAAHRAGVVHRDVKPDNIFVTQREGEDFAKVVDFGVAKLREGTEPPVLLGELPRNLSETAAGTVVGTPAYMSPEQVTGRPLDHRVDVYALGTVLYKVLAGHTPFSGADFKQLAHRIARETPARLPDTTPAGENIPFALRELVRECLQKEPGLRPTSMAEVAARLERISEHLAREAPRPPPRRRVLWRALWPYAAAVAFTAALATAVLVGRWTSPARETVIAVSSEEANSGFVTLRLESDPPGAEVWRLDTGEIAGRTPLVLTEPRADGRLKLRFVLKRHEPADVELPLNADASAHVMLRPVTRRKR